jgi:hypothetical protein
MPAGTVAAPGSSGLPKDFAGSFLREGEHASPGEAFAGLAPSDAWDFCKDPDACDTPDGAGGRAGFASPEIPRAPSSAKSRAPPASPASAQLIPNENTGRSAKKWRRQGRMCENLPDEKPDLGEG